MSPLDYFVSESLAHARTLTSKQAISYLRGFITLADEKQINLTPVRSAWSALAQCDAQLELIASGQLTLSLPVTESGTKKGQRK